jgi:anti-anti-sigma factor
LDDQVTRDKSLDIKTVHKEDGTYVIRLGELDMSACEAVDAELRRAEDGPAQRILLDVEALEFIDSTGLQVILGPSAAPRAPVGACGSPAAPDTSPTCSG